LPRPFGRLEGGQEILPAGAVSAILKLRPGLRFLDFGAEASSYFPDLVAGASPVSLARGRYGRLPLPDDSLDRILAAGVFSGMKQKAEFLAEARRLLSPGGLLCLMDAGVPEGENAALEMLRQAGFAAVVTHAEFQGAWCLTAVKGLWETGPRP
jgi:SAM-dependent methyltransferase